LTPSLDHCGPFVHAEAADITLATPFEGALVGAAVVRVAEAAVALLTRIDDAVAAPGRLATNTVGTDEPFAGTVRVDDTRLAGAALAGQTGDTGVLLVDAVVLAPRLRRAAHEVGLVSGAADVVEPDGIGAAAELLEGLERAAVPELATDDLGVGEIPAVVTDGAPSGLRGKSPRGPLAPSPPARRTAPSCSPSAQKRSEQNSVGARLKT
jgi:hypothetical protein